jgi:hypothetical protein
LGCSAEIGWLVGAAEAARGAVSVPGVPLAPVIGLRPGEMEALDLLCGAVAWS